MSARKHTRTASSLPDRDASILEQCRARATLARVLAECFAEPEPRRLAQLAQDDVGREAQAACEIVGIDRALVANLAECLPSLDELMSDRNRLFGHSVRSTCPPYELEYGRSEVFQQSQSLADIVGFYAAFGLSPTGPLAERPDHVVAQLEFLSMAALRESSAIQSDRLDAAGVCRNAQRAFLRDHAATWMPAFFARVLRESAGSFFDAAATLGRALIAAWCAALDVPSGPEWLELREVVEEDSTITCVAPDAPQVELGPTLAAAMQDGD